MNVISLILILCCLANIEVTSELTPLSLTHSNITDFDCDFESDPSDCLWTWEKDNFDPDNFEPSYGAETAWPGQNGFYRLNGEQLGKFFKKAETNSYHFYGPSSDVKGNTKGKSMD